MKFSFNRSINIYFWVTTSLLLFACLGSREIWTQEWRWGEIVRVMQLNHDYFHPILAGKIYFDKPLLSYWLMDFATALTSSLSTFAIRLPSAMAGILSIFCIYTIGKKWFNKSTGQIAAVMLSTTYYFIFWARTASTDMLNMAGILCAIAWYFCKRDRPCFFNYMIFFLIVAFTALLKGLIGPILALLIIAPDLSSRFKKHMRWSLLFSIFPAVLFYILPFYITSFFNHSSLFASGLEAVYRENFLRFFEPFDHKGSLFTYFIYLPLYLLPWSFFFFYALYQTMRKWKLLNAATKQLIVSTGLVFLFLTLSGSRRSYYVLPLLPLAILMVARWLSGESATSNTLTPNPSPMNGRREIMLFNITAILSSISLFIWFVILQPLYYSRGGLPVFSQQLQHYMQTEPHKKWHIGFFNADNRLSFYLPGYAIDFSNGNNLQQYDIVITQAKELSHLKVKTLLVTEPHLGNRLLNSVVEDAPIAVKIK